MGNFLYNKTSTKSDGAYWQQILPLVTETYFQDINLIVYINTKIKCFIEDLIFACVFTAQENVIRLYLKWIHDVIFFFYFPRSIYSLHAVIFPYTLIQLMKYHNQNMLRSSTQELIDRNDLISLKHAQNVTNWWHALHYVTNWWHVFHILCQWLMTCITLCH